MRDSITIDGRRVDVSNLDKLLFPADGLTKRDLIDYYQRIAEHALPHLRDRPLTLHRFPDGVASAGFYQKQAADYFPEWIPTVEVAKEGGSVRHVLCNDVSTLVYLANQAMITPHLWLSRADQPDRPDQLIFDLDPPEDDAQAATLAVREIRKTLTERQLPAFLKTTGSKGFHVVTPIRRGPSFDQVRAFARKLAEQTAARRPDALTTETRKSKRAGRVFLDYYRNGYAQTAVAPYGVRPRPGAPVATPLDWDELDGRLRSDRYSIGNIFRRLAQKSDPWAGLADAAVSLDAAL